MRAISGLSQASIQIWPLRLSRAGQWTPWPRYKRLFVTQSDDLSDTLDYNAVRLGIEEVCNEERFELVESLAERIAQFIMLTFSVPGLRIRLAKPEAIENTVDVGIVIARGLRF